MNSRPQSRGFPVRSSPRFFAGCQKKTGSGGTRKSKPTRRLESSIFWCVRPVKKRPRGLSRTCESIAPAPPFGIVFARLPKASQKAARKNFEPLKDNSLHPSLHFKKVGRLWSVRAGINYRALALEDGADFIWVWT